MAIEDLKFITKYNPLGLNEVGITTPPIEQTTVGTEVMRSAEEIGFVPKRNIFVEQDSSGVVTLLLGWNRDMVILYKDPTHPSKVIAKKSVPDLVVGATRSLFDAEVLLARGEGSELLKQRKLRLSEMLADLGRPDIVGAMRGVGKLPGVVNRLVPN